MSTPKVIDNGFRVCTVAVLSRVDEADENLNTLRDCSANVGCYTMVADVRLATNAELQKYREART